MSFVGAPRHSSSMNEVVEKLDRLLDCAVSDGRAYMDPGLVARDLCDIALVRVRDAAGPVLV